MNFFKKTPFHRTTTFLHIVFVISIAIIFFIAAITYRQIQNLSASFDKVTHSYEVSRSLRQLNYMMEELKTYKVDFLLTKEDSLKQQIKVQKDSITEKLKSIHLLTKDNNPLYQTKINELEVLIKEKFKLVDIAVKNENLISNEKELRRNLMLGRHQLMKIKKKIDEMLRSEQKLLKDKKDINVTMMEKTPLLIYLFGLITLGLISLAYFKMNQDLNDLKINNNQLNIASEINSFGEMVGKYGNWQWDVETGVLTFSDNLYRLLGAEPHSFEPSFEEFYNFVHPDDLDYVKQKSADMIDNENLPPFHYRLLKKDGEILNIRAMGKPVVNVSGKKMIIGTTLDISDFYKKSLEIEEKNRKLELSNKELMAFNYVASHDLQEPLRKIQTFISRLSDKEKESLSDTGKEYLERITAASMRMRILIDDLLQYSRTSRPDKIFEEEDLNLLLQNSLTDLHTLIEEKNAVINAEPLPLLKVIPFQIQQLFTNLINNSLKYSHTERKPTINIRCVQTSKNEVKEVPLTEDTTYYKITFEDNGIGFDPQYAEKIFDLFYRLHDKNEYSGTGIGLAICKKIMENHNGYITALGKPYAGAVFTMYLPKII